MILYTFISKEENDILNKQGYLVCNPEKARQNIEDMRSAYNFMRENLEKKYSKKNFPYDIEYPRWAWYQWEGDKDLFNNDTIREGYEGCCFLKIDIPEEKVLLSDFDNWHFCINGWYLYETEEEGDKVEAELHGLAYEEAKYRSWLRMFDLGFPNQFHGIDEDRTIQGVFWVLFKDSVVDAIEV